MSDEPVGDGKDVKANARGGLTQRGAIRSIGGGTLGAAMAGALPQGKAAAQTQAAPATGAPPLGGLRVIERCQTLSGRLAGQLFADQGAEVFVERSAPSNVFDDA